MHGNSNIKFNKRLIKMYLVGFTVSRVAGKSVPLSRVDGYVK